MKRLFLPVVSVVLLLANCSPSPAPTGKLPVAASFYPLAFLAEQVGGPFVNVLQITPGGVEPHDYEPTPQQLASVYDAKVFLMNGGGVDAWADKVIADVKSSGVVTVKMTGDAIHVALKLKDEKDPANIDPHFWLDPVIMQREAEIVRDALSQADPVHTSEYQQNAATLIDALITLNTEFAQGLSHCSLKQTIVSHNAFQYVAARYGFTTLPIAGFSPDQEPSSKQIADLSDLAKREQIGVIFFETLASPKLAETVAQEVGATPMVLNPIEGLTADDVKNGRTYLSIMQDNLQNLRTALHCQ